MRGKVGTRARAVAKLERAVAIAAGCPVARIRSTLSRCPKHGAIVVRVYVDDDEGGASGIMVEAEAPDDCPWDRYTFVSGWIGSVIATLRETLDAGEG